ncbi:hypothetical protein Shyhy01_25070 [Streptomyces hygroscopicus subsp. hygroscopicus]|nr:hypothetical protein Shyhy01_25070 [Streptomyces hygroscopicus subsp. hygroscopicus]
MLAGFASLAVAELVAAALRPQAGPVIAVGGASIDATPAPVKDWAIRHFGGNDKLAQQFGILAVSAVLALTLGMSAVRSRRAGAAGVLLLGAVGAVAAVSRPDSTAVTDALPSVVGAAAGALLLYVLTGRLTAVTRSPAPAPGSSAEEAGKGPPASGGRDRRGFVLAATSAAAASAAVGAVGRSLNASHGQGAIASRSKAVLPRPGSPAQPVPRRAGPRVPGTSPFVTPNADFYRVDTALVVPRVDVTGWRLRIHGEGVRRPATRSCGHPQAVTEPDESVAQPGLDRAERQRERLGDLPVGQAAVVRQSDRPTLQLGQGTQAAPHLLLLQSALDLLGHLVVGRPVFEQSGLGVAGRRGLHRPDPVNRPGERG